MLELLRFPRYYRYPHYHWAAAIQRMLTDQILRDDVTIIDAPSGDGGISYWLIKQNVGARYELCDISERLIQRTAALQSWSDRRGVTMSVSCQDIFEIDTRKSSTDVWLLINSLFLLPDVDRLVDRMSSRVEHIVGLFPHIDRRNYRCYVKGKPMTNIHPMNQEAITAFFDTHGYQLRSTQDVTFIPFHCIPTKLLKIAALHVLNPIEYLVPKRSGGYWVGLFSRNATPASVHA